MQALGGGHEATWVNSTVRCVDLWAGDGVSYLSASLGVADVLLELLLLTHTLCF